MRGGREGDDVEWVEITAAYIPQRGWRRDTVWHREAETCRATRCERRWVSKKKCCVTDCIGGKGDERRPVSRTVRLTRPVVGVLANHDDSDFAKRGIIRP